MYRTELRGRDVGCVLWMGADGLLDRSHLSAPRQQAGVCRLMRNRTGSVPGRSTNTRSNGFCSCSFTRPQKQGMDISELEFVQIILILMMMIFMIIVIICLLNHYRLPALDLLSRFSHTERNQTPQLSQDGSEWPDNVLTQQRNGQVMCGHLNSSLPPFIQPQQLCRFQPTYPYLQQEIINLPPIICLSDGEELLPYKGPCSLQLRHPDQQLELHRAAVRAPPNRTIFDGELINIYIHTKSQQALSSNSGASDANARTEDPPPSYSEVMGDHPSSAACYTQYSNNTLPTDNRLGQDSSQTVFHAGSKESTTKASTDSNKNS